MERICKNCIFCNPTLMQRIFNNYEEARCMHEKNKYTSINKFSGRKSTFHSHCESIRNPYGRCSNEGYLFNDKPLFYHTQSHIEQMMEEAGSRGVHMTKDLRFAIEYHDAVYVSGENNNEEMSRRYMWDQLCGIKEADIEAIGQAIIETKHINPPTSEMGVILCDLDLSGMIYEDSYKKNTKLIRKEWPQLSDEEYNKGRIKWLDNMLKRDRIFHSKFFTEFDEKRVVDSMEVERAELTRRKYNSNGIDDIF